MRSAAMTIQRKRALDILASLGSQPAVAYHEGAWRRWQGAILPTRAYPSGWTTSGTSSGISWGGPRGSGVAPLAIVAHMDHARFRGRGTPGRLPRGDGFGRSPGVQFRGRRTVAGRPARRGTPRRRQRRDAVARNRSGRYWFPWKTSKNCPCPAPWFSTCPTSTLDGEFIRMRAADDLAGCAAILSALAELSQRRPMGDVYGVFTRAEEIGLMGARLHGRVGDIAAGHANHIRPSPAGRCPARNRAWGR